MIEEEIEDKLSRLVIRYYDETGYAPCYENNYKGYSEESYNALSAIVKDAYKLGANKEDDKK